MSDLENVVIFDTTLRDGEQSAGAGLTPEEKIRIAHQLVKFGVDVIEAGFAASSPGEMKAIESISKEVDSATVCSLARAVYKDIEAASKALEGAKKPRIHVFISSSDLHIENQMRIDRETTLELAINAVTKAKSYVDDVEFSPMDASRTEKDFLFELIEKTIDAGATTVNIPDTVGYALPSQFGSLIKELKESTSNISKATISVHCHNDLGLAVANSMAAVENGARQVEGCINGLGERAGNAALEEIVMAIETRKKHFGLTTNVNTREIGPTSRMIANIYGFPVQYNKAIVGKNAFRHSSGIHQDGYLKHKGNFEIMNPDRVGWRGESLVLGKLSGRSGLAERMRDLGYVFDSTELNELFVEFKKLADNKNVVEDEDLLSLIAAKHRDLDLDKHYELLDVKVQSGMKTAPNATVKLNVYGKEKTFSSEGTGPVDAIFSSIKSMITEPFELVDYTVSSVTKGIDAIGEVTVRVNRDGMIYTGRGGNVDILIASAEAYVNAINRSLLIHDSKDLRQDYN